MASQISGLNLLDPTIASGLLSSEEQAEEFVLTGVGLLAGSTILLLTLIWGTCIILSRQDFQEHLQNHSSDSKYYNPLEKLLVSLWPGYGVITDLGTSFTARIMLLSVIPLVIILIPTAFHLSLHVQKVFVIITLVVCLLFLISYFFYQVLKPWVQKKREEREMMDSLLPDILEHLQSSAYGTLLAEDGSPDVAAIKRLFKDVDLDHSNSISYSELLKLVTKIQSGILPGDADLAVSRMMEELDVNGDESINEEEFVMGVTRWLNPTNDENPKSKKIEDDNYQKTWEQTDKLIDDKFIDKSALAWIKAISLLVLGIVILGILAEPLVHSVRGFSTATNLPSFYVAFVLIPLASNARLAVSAINETRKRKLHTTSLTLSEIYGTVFMNNILGLAVLLSLTYFKGVAFKFSAEILMVLFVSVIIGCLSSVSTIFPVWTSFLAYLLYPLSLVLVYSIGDFVS
ncbi:hypothetical protein F511_36510 [Dorcoceras hygrometricum]|uniref:EF-hand domain-containing protein n=1 Tax=Dorcoceras hygrometricum TaxID=472368 RepID=A0A2Z7C1V7_9LAMI|nr:hypothetical protein F511_36510 [Dorcoceras hygrometricum]